MTNHSRRKAIRRRSKRLAAAVAGAAIMSAGMLPGVPAAHASPNVPVTTAAPTATPTTTAAPATAPAVTPTTTAAPATAPAVTPTTTTAPATAPAVTPTTTTAPAAAPAAMPTTTAAPTTAPATPTATKAPTTDPTPNRYGHWGQRDRDWGRERGGNWGVRDRDWAYADRACGNENSECPASDIPDECNLDTLATQPAAPQTITTDQPVVTQTVTTNQQTLYQTANYDNWQWNESTYPQDMAFGVFLQNPLQGGTATPIPNDALGGINNIDFSRQLVVYAHLGTTAAQGYGIGITSVVQNGNDLTVTVRFESPQPNVGVTATKADDLVPIDRTAIDFNNPINVTFIDQNGTVLNSHTINPS